jgi:bifunctional non-homologous end joining protein LigD
MTSLRPMKAVAAEMPAAADDDLWAYEIKWDGYRTLAEVDTTAGRATLWSSNGIDATTRFAPCAQVWQSVNAEHAVLDGEVIALDATGRPSFQALQQGTGPLAYVLFDVLSINGNDVTALPYVDRRRLLEQLIEEPPEGVTVAWRVGGSQVGDGASLVEATRRAGLEGVIAKRLDSPYLPGRRSPAWRKVKHRLRIEMVIGGFTAGSGARASTLGAVALGAYDADGRLVYAGRAGSGFTERSIRELLDLLRPLVVAACPFDPLPPAAVRRGVTWVRPELVAEVEYAERTSDGILRHPVFLGLRDDKSASDVTFTP